MSLLCLSGSLRSGSHNTALLREVCRVALGSGVRAMLWTRTASVPPYDSDREDRVPGSVAALRARVRESDGLVIATPEYNGGMPGQLKNVLDWLSRPHRSHCLVGMPVAVVSASPSGFGAVAAREQVERVLGAMESRVVPSGVAVPRAHEAFDAAGRLRDPVRRRALAGAVDALCEEASRVPARSRHRFVMSWPIRSTDRTTTRSRPGAAGP